MAAPHAVLIILASLLAAMILPIHVQAASLDALTEANIQTMVSAQAVLPDETTRLNSTIHYVPTNTPSQTLTGLTITSQPTAYQSGNHHSITLYWPKPAKDIEFTISSTLETKPTFITFNKTDPYPPRISKEGDLQPYLRPGVFIDSTHPQIIATSRAISDRAASQQDLAWQAAEWVRTNIKYNLSTITQDVSQKASWTLANKQGVCDELSALFIAIVRAAGIPARFVNGIVYSDSGAYDTSWGSHAWAEVWFPSAGWVPFDVTFGQLGWLDAGHVRIADSQDIDESSVDYRWQGPEDADFSPVTIRGVLNERQKTTPPPIDITIASPAPAGSASTIAILARIANPNDQWIPITAYLITSPEIAGESIKAAILPPDGKATLPFLLTLPETPDDETYSLPIEIRLSTGQTAKTSVQFSRAYESLTLPETLEDLALMELEQKLDLLPSLETSCRPPRRHYNLLENITITCTHRNNGAETLAGQTCLNEDCASFEIPPGEETDLTFSHLTTTTTNHTFHTTSFTEAGPKTKRTFAPVHSSFSPSFSVATAACPERISYDENSLITITLNSTAPIADIALVIDGIGGFRVGTKTGETILPIPIRGSDLPDDTNDILIYSKGTTPDGRRAEDFERCTIQVDGRPWWSRLLRHVLG